MKKIHKISISLLLALFMVGIVAVNPVQAQETKAAKEQKVAQDQKIGTIKYWASMDCEECKAKIEKNIAFEKGVKDLKVDLPSKIVTVKYHTDKTSDKKIEKAIQKLGFTTEIVTEDVSKKEKKEK